MAELISSDGLQPHGGGASLDYDMLSPDALADPWSYLARIRAQAPVFWSDHQQAWLITRYREFKKGLVDKRFSSVRDDIYWRDLKPEAKLAYPYFVKYTPMVLSFLDHPEHTHLRAIVMQAFSQAEVEKLRAMTVALVDEILDGLEDGSTVEFMAEIAFQLPSRLMMQVFNIPDSHRENFVQMAFAFNAALGAPQVDEVIWGDFERGAAIILPLIAELAREARSDPKDNLFGKLVSAHDDGRILTEDELLAVFLTLISAGIDTTSLATGVFSIKLIEQTELAERMRAGGKPAANLITELLRHPGLIKAQSRKIAEDFEFAGAALKAGQFAYFMHSAANTDPDVFPEPLEIKPDRNDAPIVTFGHGAHHCIGSLLARMELQELMPRLFARFDLDLVEQPTSYLPSYALYGLETIHTRVRRR